MKRLRRVTPSAIDPANNLTLTPTDLVCFLLMIEELKDCNISLTEDETGHAQITINDRVYDIGDSAQMSFM